MSYKNIILIGQPNSGKSTIFNVLSDIKTSTSNFAGSSGEINETIISFGGEGWRLYDLPGVYSLNPTQESERITLEFITKTQIDLIINVVDATSLTRSLELTCELLELGLPMIVALNMMDEASAHGVSIDTVALAAEVGNPVVETSALKGKGIKQLLEAGENYIRLKKTNTNCPRFTRHIEGRVAEIENAMVTNPFPSISRRFVAIKAIEYPSIIPTADFAPLNDIVQDFEKESRLMHNMDGFESISYERHHLAMKVSEKVSKFVARRSRSRSDIMDDALLHPLWGQLIMLCFFFIYFFAIFYVGSLLSALVEPMIVSLGESFAPLKESNEFLWFSINGAYMGFAGVVGIVLPYFLPLVLITSLFEESGYLARVAFLSDGLFHRIGLHGKSAVPLILGFGCAIPAIYATRILENKRDRQITSVLLQFIPCSARIAVIFALTAAFTGPVWAVIVFAYVLFVIAASGKIMSKMLTMPIGLVLEIPRLKVPSLSLSFAKTWMKTKDFAKEAVIFLVLGSIVLGWIEYFNVAYYIDLTLSPITGFVLGLPDQLGSTLVFGFLRKELIIVMASQALQVQSIAELPLTSDQIITFIIFVTFYFPCLTTFVVLSKEFGKKFSFAAASFSVLVALVSATLFRLILSI